jgi:hypothetical protein
MPPAIATVPDPHRLARAFLALTDEPVAEPLRTAAWRTVVAMIAVLVLAIGAPATWMGPTVRSLDKPGDQPAAMLGSSKAGLAAAGDDDDEGAGH